MIKNIIFDFDGVLVDSEILARKAFSRYLYSHDIHLSELEFSKKYSGNKLTHVVSKICSRFNIEDKNKLLEEIMSIAQKIYNEELKPVHGVENFLEISNHNKFIGSNRGKISILEVLSNTNLIKYFPEKNIFSFDMVDKPKPEPDIYLKTIIDNNLKKNETIVLEDSIIGVQSSIAAGIKVVGITAGGHWTDRSSQSLIDAGAFCVASSFKDVIKILKNYD